MKRFTALSLVVLMCCPLSVEATTFIPCCAEHSEMVGVWTDSLSELVSKVRSEDQEQFLKKYHKPECLTYLQLLVHETQEGLKHYRTMIESSDPTILDLEGFKRSQKAVEALKAKAGEYAKKIKGAKTDKAAKTLIESIELKLEL